MQLPRGKPPTRGPLHIMRDNAQINSMYQSLTLSITLLRLIISALCAVVGINPNLSSESALNIIMSHFSIPVLLMLINYVMKRVSVPLYSNTPERRLISPGYDLNMQGGLGDNLKDITVIIVLTHMLTVISNLFWLILLYLPLRALYISWKLLIRPFLVMIFSDNEEEDTERSKKKTKKAGNKKKFKYLRTIKHWHHFRS